MVERTAWLKELLNTLLLDQNQERLKLNESDKKWLKEQRG